LKSWKIQANRTKRKEKSQDIRSTHDYPQEHQQAVYGGRDRGHWESAKETNAGKSSLESQLQPQLWQLRGTGIDSI
jgi:hypothetical protein